MGFVNETVKKEDERIFTIFCGEKFKPSTWTINREKDERLIMCGTSQEPPLLYYFVFEIKETLLSLEMKRDIIGNECRWVLDQINIPKNMNKEEVLSELNDAFKIYGLTGWVNFNPSTYTYTFDRGNY